MGDLPLFADLREDFLQLLLSLFVEFGGRLLPQPVKLGCHVLRFVLRLEQVLQRHTGRLLGFGHQLLCLCQTVLGRAQVTVLSQEHRLSLFGLLELPLPGGNIQLRPGQLPALLQHIERR